MKNTKKFFAVFDTHGKHIDREAAAAALEFKKHWKPHITIHGGDAFDFTALRKGASDEEKNEGVQEDVEAGLDFLKQLKPNVFLLGNHDFRMIRAMNEGCGRLREYATLLYNSIMDRLMGIQIVPYGKREGIYQLGQWKVVHGYSHGLHAGRQAAATYGNVFMGHIHASSVYSMPTIEPTSGVTVGCLCDLNLEYTKSQCATLRWSHSWLYGLLFPSGAVAYWLARKVDGKWILPSEMTTL